MNDLRARLAAGTLLASLAIVTATALLSARASLDGRSATIAVCGFLLVMGAAVTAIGLSHPYPRVGLANWVTTTRAALVAMIGALLVEPVAPDVATLAVVLASTAAALDGLDGWLARRTGMHSAFGARFDMEVDALLILLLGVFVWRYEKAGAWVLLSGALRYLFVAAGWLTNWFERTLFASTRRKAVCVIQIVGLIVAMSPLIPRPFSEPAAAVTLTLLVWSFAVDVRWLWRRRFEPLAG